jgi:microcystin-dependent protein
MEPFIGEIRLFSFGKAPNGWAVCEGQTLPISRNQALFAILGTKFGGDGVSTFKLPDLRGRAPVAASPSYPVGAVGGEDKHTLVAAEMPSHTHAVAASTGAASLNPIAGDVWASSMSYGDNVNTTMAPEAIGTTGGGMAHNNMQPYLATAYCIALQGIFPSRP